MTDFAPTAVNSHEDLVRRGDREALATLLAEHADRLHRWIAPRLDRRIQGRVSASDVVQEVYLAADQRREHFAFKPDMPFGVWVRLLAAQRLIEVHRRYLGAAARAVDREVPIDAGSGSDTLAARLPGRQTTPSHSAIRKEDAELLREALGQLEPGDREVLALRHFEELTNEQVAASLSIGTSAATKRYMRALARLKAVLDHVSGLRTDLDKPGGDHV